MCILNDQTTPIESGNSDNISVEQTCNQPDQKRIKAKGALIPHSGRADLA